MEFFVEDKPVKKLYHKLLFNKEQTERFQDPSWNVKSYVCKVCGAIKVVSKRHKLTSISYIRSGRIANYIECIDMEKENQKTID